MQEIARNDADVGGIQIEILGTYNKQSTLFRQEINSLGRQNQMILAQEGQQEIMVAQVLRQ